MRIAKPILLVSTPIGVIGGLVFIMAAIVAVTSASVASVVSIARREQAALRAGHKPATSSEVCR
jgi:hypothetical protein